MTQKDFPTPPNLATGTRYLVYLDVWERHITALEDDYIREKALGGPDTATRTQVVWQVKIDDGKEARLREGPLDSSQLDERSVEELGRPGSNAGSPHISAASGRVSIARKTRRIPA